MLFLRGKLASIVLLCVSLLVGVVIMENLASYYLKKSILGRNIVYFEKKEVALSNEVKLSYLQYDRDLGCSLKPNTKDVKITNEFTVGFFINSHGIRDKQICLEKPNCEFRILALGESTIFGEGVNYGKRLTEVIEQALNRVEMVNMGIQGIGMDQSFLQLKRDGFKFNPDAAILFIFNPDYINRCMDITGRGSTSPKPRFVLSEDRKELVLQDVENSQKELESEIYPIKSNTLGATGKVKKRGDVKNNKIRNSYSNVLTLVNYYAVKERIDKAIRAGDTKHFSNILEICAWQDKRRERYKTEDFEKLIALLMVEYQKICRGHGVDFIVVNIGAEKLSSIERICKEFDISYLDLSEIIIRAAQFKQLQFPIDRHYNDIYHRIGGEYVSEYLRRKYNLKNRSDFSYQYLSILDVGKQ